MPPQEGATSRTERVEQVLALAARGWHVFPLRPDDKRPAVKEWEQRATLDPDRIARAWTDGPYGVGIACGPSGLVVVDLDTVKGDEAPPAPWDLLGVIDGSDVFAELYARQGDRFPFGTTPMVRTRSGGLHVYYAASAQVVRNSASKVGWKIDVRANGGYVVAPPSTVEGRPYTWTTPLDAQLESVPGWLLPLLLGTPAQWRGTAHDVTVREAHAPSVRPVDSLAGLVHFVLKAQPGERNSRLYWAACRALELVRGGGIDQAGAVASLIDAGTYVGLSPTEADATVRSADRAPARAVVSV
ncbi:bifunctional DNA primase/polymerase [Streptomyces sp. NPDC050658]|uniref:bifunctional DNA primase/polymerase n=1 Tax=unclassified Streptomyces TaxID=2593676 RepID=UPI00341DF3AD